jgi:hypothetical protein
MMHFIQHHFGIDLILNRIQMTSFVHQLIGVRIEWIICYIFVYLDAKINQLSSTSLHIYVAIDCDNCWQQQKSIIKKLMQNIDFDQCAPKSLDCRYEVCDDYIELIEHTGI